MRAYLVRWADRATLVAMGLGLAILLQPWWAAGMRVGFWLTLIATLAQIVASPLPRGGGGEAR